jgi:hypothetical protein
MFTWPSELYLVLVSKVKPVDLGLGQKAWAIVFQRVSCTSPVVYWPVEKERVVVNANVLWNFCAAHGLSPFPLGATDDCGDR